MKYLFLFLAVIALGCGTDEKEAGDCSNGVVVEIQDNHPTGDHKLTITTDDVNAAVEKEYDITGDNTGHTHSLTVTTDNFESLQDGSSVTIESSDTGAVGNDHTHDVVLSCA